MAEVQHSKWIVLYVETAKFKELSKKDKERINKNFSLAEQLGGEIVTLYGDNIPEQIIAYAKFRNVSKIVIGKNHRKRYSIFHFFTEDIIDKLLATDIDVCIIPILSSERRNKRIISKLFTKFNVSINEIFRSGIIISISAVIAKILDYLGFAEANIIMIFILGVLIVYIVTTGYFIGIISSIASVLIFNYFFTAPRNSFQFYNKSYLATFPMMLVVSIIIGTLTSKIQREGRNSSEREKRTQILYRVSRKLLRATGVSDVISIGIKYISRLLEENVVCYLGDENKLSEPFVYYFSMEEKDNSLLNKEEEAAAYWTFSNVMESGAGTDTFYGAKGYYIPLKVGEKILGVLGISCVNGILSPEQKFIFETVAGQISIALDREILSEMQKNIKLEIESERLRSNLLRSISHDLRSPLAGIKGSVSTIIENEGLISTERKAELLSGIYDDTEWLIRLVENLLSMTKLDEGKMHIEKNMELIEEVIYEAAQRTSKRFKDHELKVSVPENVIMVPMDGNLIEQVLINLIDNALKFTPKNSLIEIKAYEEENNVIFQVLDNGPGISEKILPNIFERFFTNGSSISDSRRGVGLGLAICKSIVEAHGGTISACNREEGGAAFSFNIPKEDEKGG